MRQIRLGRGQVEADIALAQLKAAELQTSKALTLRRQVGEEIVANHFYTVKQTHLPNAKSKGMMDAFCAGIEDGLSQTKAPLEAAQKLTRDLLSTVGPRIHIHILMGLVKGHQTLKTHQSRMAVIEPMFKPDVVLNAITLFEETNNFTDLFILLRAMVSTALLKDTFFAAIRPELAADHMNALVKKGHYDKVAELVTISETPYTAILLGAITDDVLAKTALHLVNMADEKERSFVGKGFYRNNAADSLDRWIRIHKTRLFEQPGVPHAFFADAMNAVMTLNDRQVDGLFTLNQIRREHAAHIQQTSAYELEREKRLAAKRPAPSTDAPAKPEGTTP